MVLFLPTLPLLGVAMLIWVIADPWWHPLMIAVAVCLLVFGLAAAVRRIILNERAIGLTSRPLDNYRWLPQWDAATYLRHFELFLRVRGWRIIAASEIAPDRILLVADKSKSKTRIALLGVRPTQCAAAADVESLDAARKEQRATRAALVVDQKPAAREVHAALDRGILTLRFADLGTMDDALNVVD